LQFADGDEQRFRTSPASLRRWIIHVELATSAEIAALEQFFEKHNGSLGSFEFEDPESGELYPDCSFEHGAMNVEFKDEERAVTELVIRENR
jgi:hypothetical protein